MAGLLPLLRVRLDDPLDQVPEPRRLEIGFGGGEHLAQQALFNPRVAFIGAEPFVNGVAKLLAQVEDLGLKNVRVHDGDARALLEVLPAGQFQRVDLLYPDPWPKARHLRRRFVSAETLAHIHRILVPDGQFRFASDVEDYILWTRQHIGVHGGFAEAGDPAKPYEDWVVTRYEAKARREGRASSYLTFCKLA
jgi:tRNA (guanine-N7-)-methyltransferase